MDSMKPSAHKLDKIDSQDDASTSKQMVKSLGSKAIIFCDFSDTVSIRVKDKYFNVPRALLIADSIFFEEEPDNSTPRKLFLALDDIDAELFNTYIKVLFEWSFSPGFKIQTSNVSSRAIWTANLKFLLRLWKLSHHLHGGMVCLLTEEAMTTQYFASITPDRWEMVYVEHTEADVRQQLLALQECYTLCKDESIPFEEQIVTACANCPGQIVAAHFDHLDPGFKAEVVKSFAMRVADPKLAQRKRDHADESETKVSKKRRS